MLICFSYAAAAVSGVAIGMISSWELVFSVFVIAAALGGILCVIGKGRLAVKIRELDSMK